MLFFALEPERKLTTLPNSKQIQPLIIDLLRRKLMVNTQCHRQNPKPSRVHSKFARDALATELFPVDLDGQGNPQTASWKVGDSILSMRKAAMDSNCQGWIEVTVRSPNSRLRRLLKWRKEAISESPESLLPFWEQLHTNRSRTLHTPEDQKCSHVES